MSLIDVDECEDGTNDCDPDFGTCENTVGSYTCHCEPGFTEDRKRCSGKEIPDPQLTVAIEFKKGQNYQKI